MRCCSKATIPPEHQPDAVLSQANPVSGTKYTVLDTTKNIRIISIMAKITWATTQPSPLEVHITIDGQTLSFHKNNPVSAATYLVSNTPTQPENSQALQEANGSIEDSDKAFIYEGRSVKIEAEITWATTQPTPLVCRVKYAKW